MINKVQLECLKYWLQNTESLFLISGDKGEVYWCNQAFEQFIKYTKWELTGDDTHKGLPWTKFSVDDQSLEADLIMAKECHEGIRKKYSIKKQYIPKGEKPIWVDLEVIRYPYSGKFEFFLTRVVPMKNGTLAAFTVSMEKIGRLTQSIKGIEEKVEEIPNVFQEKIEEKTDVEKTFMVIARLVEKYPKISFAIMLAIVVSVAGEKALATIKQFLPMIGY